MNSAIPSPKSSDIPLSEKLDAILGRVRHAKEDFQRSIAAEAAAAPPTVPCEQHPEVNRSYDPQATQSASWQERCFVAIYTPCRECERAYAETRMRSYWTKRGVPNILASASLQDYQIDGQAGRAEALRVCRGYATVHRGFLFLLGMLGTGKTHLAVGVLKLIGDGLLITHPDLLTELRATYHPGGGTHKFIERLKKTRCLVLDDFGTSPGGADEGPLLFQILSSRHGEGLPTIITSNEELPTIMDLFGERLADRIAENYQTAILKGDSWRRRNQRVKTRVHSSNT